MTKGYKDESAEAKLASVEPVAVEAVDELVSGIEDNALVVGKLLGRNAFGCFTEQDSRSVAALRRANAERKQKIRDIFRDTTALEERISQSVTAVGSGYLNCGGVSHEHITKKLLDTYVREKCLEVARCRTKEDAKGYIGAAYQTSDEDLVDRVLAKGDTK